MISSIDGNGTLQVDSLKYENESLFFDKKQTYHLQVIVNNSVYGWDDIKISNKNSAYYITVSGNPKVINRRKYPRMPLHTDCEITMNASRFAFPGQMVNICANGYAIQTECKDISGAKGTLITVQTKGASFLEHTPLKGYVIRVTDNDGTYIVGCRMLEDNHDIFEYVNKHYHGN